MSYEKLAVVDPLNVDNNSVFNIYGKKNTIFMFTVRSTRVFCGCLYYLTTRRRPISVNVLSFETEPREYRLQLAPIQVDVYPTKNLIYFHIPLSVACKYALLEQFLK